MCRRRRRHDPGMIERGNGLGLAFEPFECLGRCAGGKDLDRDLPIEACIARAIHLAHPACSQRREDLIGAKPSPCVEPH